MKTIFQNKLLHLFALMVLTCQSACNPTVTPNQHPTTNATQQTTPPIAIEYVGEITNSDALVGLFIQGNQAKAYMCGGDKSWKTNTAWFSGTAQDGNLQLSSKDGRQLAGYFPVTAPPRGITEKPSQITSPPMGFTTLTTPESATGSIVLSDKTELTWSAVPALTEKGAGLYRLEDTSKNLLAGVVVHNDGRSNGVLNQGGTKPTTFQLKLLNPADPSRCLKVMALESTTTETFRIAPITAGGKPCSQP